MFCSIIIQGPPGPPGAAGAPGPPGAPGAAGRLLGDEIDEFGNDFDSINVESVKNGSALSTDYNYVNPLSPVSFFVILISMIVKAHAVRTICMTFFFVQTTNNSTELVVSEPVKKPIRVLKKPVETETGLVSNTTINSTGSVSEFQKIKDISSNKNRPAQSGLMALLGPASNSVVIGSPTVFPNSQVVV